MKVRSAMTRDVVCLSPENLLDEAHELMREYNVRHVPVVDDEKLIGIISERDVLLRAKLGDDGSIEVPALPLYEVMTTDVITCRPDSLIADVAATMLEHRIGCLPVISNAVLVGLVTSSDLMDLLCKGYERYGRSTIPFTYSMHQYAGRHTAPRAWEQLE